MPASASPGPAPRGCTCAVRVARGLALRSVTSSREDGGGALERFYARLARRLYRWRGLVWLLGLLACGGFAYLVFDSSGDLDPPLMALSVALVLWVLGLLTTIHGFAEPLPDLGGASALARLRGRIARLVRWVMAWVMTALAAVVVLVSARALALAFRSLSG